MRALTVQPGRSLTARIDDRPEPVADGGEMIVDGLELGVCDIDREIAAGDHGWAPPGCDRLILGHESLGRVRQAPPDSGFAPGDLVVGVVRRPDPKPCGACAHGEYDMCRNGYYTERGVKERDGYAAEVWTVEPAYAVKLDPRLARVGVLMEPTTVVVKAWEQVDRIGARAWFEPRRVLVTGAGPTGLLAALLGVRRGLEVHIVDRVLAGPKVEAIRALGAVYHHVPVTEVAGRLRPDVVIEATGAGSVAFDAVANTGSYGITCLTGVSAPGRVLSIDAGTDNRRMVLGNEVVVGSVAANLGRYRAAAEALARADLAWLQRLITRRVPLEKFTDALTDQHDDIKVVLALTDESR